MFWFGRRRKEVEKLKEETQKSFASVKEDMNSIGEWIKHLDAHKKSHKKDIFEVKECLSTIKKDIEELKKITSVIYTIKPNSVFKTPKQKLEKQTPVYPVQTGVQTGVQTPNLEVFSITEKAIIWLLLTTDMKLSYDDLSAMLSKEKSTIRGQINTIKQKGGVIEEIVEKNGRKRVYIPEKIKENILKKSKVRV